MNDEIALKKPRKLNTTGLPEEIQVVIIDDQFRKTEHGAAIMDRLIIQPAL